MRQANWHEVGGNARVLKGNEEEALKQHESPSNSGAHAGRGTQAGGQPSHKQALYPVFPSRKRK